jgi:flagellar biosynthetic protein FlhB
MSDESDLEKTEEASEKRVEKAREDGDVPRSKELGTCMLLLAAGFSFMMLGGKMGSALIQYFTDAFRFNRDTALNSNLMLTQLADHTSVALLAFVPLGVILFGVAMSSPILIGGWNFNTNALIPKFDRLNPIRGAGNIISVNALVELVKAILKSLVVGTIAYLVIVADFPAILSLSTTPLDIGMSELSKLLTHSFLMIVGGLVLIAAIDVPYQLKHYSNKLKMTKEEARQESKETNGNPEVKGRIRQQQREMARRRMMSEIPKADVIITNPTHYAVAIKYAEGGNGAPRVVAKGSDVLALKIREIAKDHKIPTLESPKLARALFAHTELGNEIPEALYSAVAEILAFVYQLRHFKQQGGAFPTFPSNVPVPDALDPHLTPTNLKVA